MVDHNAGEDCDVVISVFTYIKITWDRVRNMFVTVLKTITTIWRPGFVGQLQARAKLRTF